MGASSPIAAPVGAPHGRQLFDKRPSRQELAPMGRSYRGDLCKPLILNGS